MADAADLAPILPLPPVGLVLWMNETCSLPSCPISIVAERGNIRDNPRPEAESVAGKFSVLTPAASLSESFASGHR